MTFRELGLIEPILGALAELGYEQPSPIQEKAIPPALSGRDVLGCAQTGTGKTCAFASPILQRLSAAKPQGRPIRALILTPTRELALQIQESFEAYGKHLPLRSTVIFGGVGQAPQVERLKRGVDVLVATPGRLADLYQQKLLDFSHLEIFVLDEADRMLDMGFIHDVKKILRWLPAQKQTLFFSATMPREISDLVDSLLHDPVKVAVDPVSSPVEVIDQKLYYVDRGNKTKLLASLLGDDVKNALVFTRTKHGANKVAGDLVKSGITAAAIHGNKSQTARQQALADFKSGRVKVLVATDIAARGLDIEELSHVFNYNLPDVPETYVHRIGRTGRAGHGGTAISFCDINEKSDLKSIEKLLQRSIPVVEDHPWPMEIFEPLPKDKKGRVVNPEDAEARAAAKERRRARDAANKAAAEERKARAAQKIMGSDAESAPRKKASAQEEVPAAARKKRARGYRASATLEEALTATAPAQPVREARSRRTEDFHHADPLAGDTIMDATARLLAPRPRTLSQKQERDHGGRDRRRKSARGHEPRKAETVHEAPKSEERSGRKKGSTPVKALDVLNGGNARKKRKARGSGGGRPRETVLRTDGVKDSTELSASLMKPYYLSDED
ncbi:DEAD/DEAH box helicase [Pseudoflavonifractor sp. MSJ-37]|uniref:DEAD/DEAH box helicase n=1 Tax=Pseudoflavonifractor sp. MSJ-37 TaxID=2841531 RepID=UPI001C11EEB8|nr:DEAD/DEAH box helicase [Pseudoflavonifractor sp. MSJ-37]MBU5435980.1 DEAD/DEAH box helicase [Pseudoflavonifractor sp. MSJ-37]